MKKLLFCLLWLWSSVMLWAQSIIPASDYAPNIEFTSGDFTNWKCYTGTFSCDNPTAPDADKTYTYNWTPMAHGSDRIQLKGEMDTMDPIVREDGLYINPYPGKKVARIGVPAEHEGSGDYAAAEKLEYTFTVKNETTVLKYCFAAVLHIASTSNHVGAEFPAFSVAVTVKKPDGSYVTPNCSAYSTIVSASASDLKPVTDCSPTISGVDPKQYMFRPWTSALVDLREYKDCEVTLSVIVHDCLARTASATGTGIPYAGSHEGYAYFRAEAMDLTLSTRVCNAEDPQIAAPKDFAGYKWTRSNNFPLTETGNVLTLPYGDMVPGVTYTCVLSDEIGCAAIDLSTQLDPVTVNPSFNYEAKCGGLVEFESTATVSGDNMVNWIWNAGEGESSGSVSNHVYDEPGDYQVKLTAVTSNGCQQSVTQTVTVPYFPDLQISTPTHVCQGKEINIAALNVEYGSQVTWSSDAPGQTFPSANSFQTTPTQTQVYTAQVTDPRGCLYTASKQVVLFDKENVYIAGDAATCPNQGVELTLHGGTLNDIVWNVAGAANQNTITVYPNEDATYSVTATDVNGCMVEATHPIEVYPVPDFTVNVPTVCEGEDAVITAAGAQSYQWIGLPRATSGATQVIPQLTQSSEYDVVGYTDKGCSSTQHFAVNVTPKPVVEVMGDLQRCFDSEPFEITAHGADRYLWNGVEGENSFTAVSDRNHEVTLVGMVGTCLSDPMNLTLSTLEKPTLVPQQATWEVCKGDEVALTVTGADNYVWTNSTEQSETLQVAPTENQVYVVQGISANGCMSNPLEIPVTVHEPNQLMLHVEQAIACPNQPDSAVVVAAGAAQYEWTSIPDIPGLSSHRGDMFAFSYDTPTTVIVKGTNEFGCTGQAQVDLALLPEPVFDFEVQPTMIEAGASNVRFKGLAPGNVVSWFWNVGDGSALLQARDTVHTYSLDYLSEPFKVEVTAVDEHGCRFQGETEIKIWKEIQAPTAFTPNHDGLNDLFQFYGLDHLLTFDFYIYNRLGEVVFEGKSPNDAWDGTYQGQPCPWGVYGWVAHYTADVNGELRENTLKGHVSIVK